MRIIVRVMVAVCLVATQLMASQAMASVMPTLELCARLDLNGSTVGLPRNVPAKPSPDGSVYPVLFVHGFNDTSETWTRPALASWSDPPTVRNPTSFTDMIDTIPGALPVLFDYSENSLEWVTNAAIGDALGKVIDCLASHSGQKVAMVAHSMGGLAARQALSNQPRAPQVSLVITIGTPNLGSFLPVVASGASLGADVINRWAQTASDLGNGGSIGADVFLTAYYASQKYLVDCKEKIVQKAASGVCGDITALVAASESSAGLALAAGSKQLLALPAWPKQGVDIYAVSSNYVGFGADDWLGDGVVYPRSAIAGAPRFSSTQCALLDRPWINELGARRNGCWHVDQPANQNIIPLALTKLRDDISARSRSVVDWRNTTYTLTCDGIAQNGFQASLQSGAAQVSGASAGVQDYDHFAVNYEAAVSGDLTGDGRQETAVLLFCSPQASNFFVQEVQVFSGDKTLLGVLPSAESLKSNSSLPPVYVPSELTINGGNVSAGMMFYGPSDTHASGPSEHRTVVWRWDGVSFTRVS